MADIDDDLRDLLDTLDEHDEFLPSPDDDTVIDLEEPDEPDLDDLEPSEPDDDDDDIDPVLLETSDKRVLRPVDMSRPIDERAPSIKEDVPSFMQEYIDRMDSVTEEVLQACRADRQEAQDLINMMRGQADASIAKGTTPARMYIDGLVKAVEVKANINQNAIKMMEANSKMIASMKPGSGTTINNLQVNNSELDEILNNPVPQDGELD